MISEVDTLWKDISDLYILYFKNHPNKIVNNLSIRFDTRKWIIDDLDYKIEFWCDSKIFTNREFKITIFKGVDEVILSNHGQEISLVRRVLSPLIRQSKLTKLGI